MNMELDEGVFAGLIIEKFDTDVVGMELIDAACDADVFLFMKELGLHEAWLRYMRRSSSEDLPMPEPWVRFFKLLKNSPYKAVILKMYKMKFGLECPAWKTS